MNHEWRVEFTEAAAKELRKLDKSAQQRIVAFLEERVAGQGDPRRFGQALTGSLAGLWRYRVGDYRIIASFEDDRFVVVVVRVGHRREIYR